MATAKKKKVIIVSGDEDANGLIEHFIVVIDERLTEQDKRFTAQDKRQDEIEGRVTKCEHRVSTLETRIAIYVVVALTVLAMGWQFILKVFK